ncbi:MAG: CbiQ family ECF transporter T component, partial [Candidatus Thorarchaeota archaeon]|nr:CbiQ family ECF transporter T component [Candidatus Thorarchaeota archaeon]
MSFLELFQYTRQDSLVHNLDPRAKLLLSIVLAAISLMFITIIPLLIIIACLLPLIAAAKSLRRWAKSMKGLAPLLLFIIIFNTLLST